jgi:hypothetical protein
MRSVGIPAAAYEDTRLTGADLNVLGAISFHTDRAGWCRDKQPEIARIARLARGTVIVTLKKLARLGYVEVFRSENGDRNATKYRAIMDTARAPAAEKAQPVGDVMSDDMPPHVASDDKGDVRSDDILVRHDDMGCQVTGQPPSLLDHPPYSPPTGDELSEPFEEIWAAFARTHASAGLGRRGKGKSKTFEIFKRKAAVADPNVIRAAALAEVQREKANKGGRFLSGLSVWLNAEPWDDGANVLPFEAPDWDLRLEGWRESRNWRQEWGPNPDQPDCRAPKPEAVPA